MISPMSTCYELHQRALSEAFKTRGEPSVQNALKEILSTYNLSRDTAQGDTYRYK